MEQKQIKKSADQIQAAADSLHETAQIVEFATDSVKKSAESVETNVSQGIQPDLRDLTVYVAELHEMNNVRMKRITYSIWVLFALNISAILVALFF